MTTISDETRRLLASQKAYMGNVTQTDNKFDKLKMKPIEKTTAHDRELSRNNTLTSL